MPNHLHLVVEAEDRVALSRGMQGLMVRMALHLNSALRRRGKVFADRFHARAMRTTLDVKRTLQYVLNNALRHGIAFNGVVDPYSSGAWFNGWCDDRVVRPTREPPVALARTWQLTKGWLIHGRIQPVRGAGSGSPVRIESTVDEPRALQLPRPRRRHRRGPRRALDVDLPTSEPRS